jgi:signal transduction histidine kinase/CheY-like chemotaxis protein
LCQLARDGGELLVNVEYGQDTIGASMAADTEERVAELMNETPGQKQLKWKALVEALQTCVAAVSDDLALEWLNPAFARLLGVDQAQCVGRAVHEVLGIEAVELQRFGTMVERARAGMPVRRERLVCGWSQASPRTLAIDLARVGAQGFLLEVIDLDAQEFASRYQDLAAQVEITAALAGVGFWTIDVATGIVRADARTAQFSGIPLLTTTGVPVEQFFGCIHAHDHPAFIEARHNSLKRNDSVAVEFRLRPPEGGAERVMMSRMRSRRGPDGRAVEVIGVSLDITDQRATEAVTHELRERMALATQVAGIGIWQRDLLTGNTQWDEQMFALRGLLPAQGDPNILRSTMLHPDDFAAMEAKIVHAIEHRESYAHEFRVSTPEGGWRWLASRGKVVLDAAGKPARMLGVNFDITEQKRAAEALRAQAAAESANQAKSDFLSQMSHELRTPLNAILGFAQLLRVDRAHPLAYAQLERIDRIEHAGWHLLELINDVLDLSRIEAGAMRLAEERVELKSLVAEAVHLVEAQARTRNVRLLQPVPGVEAHVIADRMRLRQVLINLLTNAIKYNHEGGQVSIEFGIPDGNSDAYRLTVRDTGRGMTSEQLGELFQPFNRLGAERLGIEGTGIGLALSHHLVEAMGGSMHVESGPGQGSTFAIDLPSASAVGWQTVPRAAEAAQEVLGVRPEVTGSLLYVEDNPVNAMLIRDYMSFRPGVSIDVVSTAQEGLELALRTQPDIVLVDISLPDFDGFELFRRLRLAWDASHPLCCVALSANAMQGDAQRARELGLADYWTKPIDPQVFLAGVDALLASRRRA